MTGIFTLECSQASTETKCWLVKTVHYSRLYHCCLLLVEYLEKYIGDLEAEGQSVLQKYEDKMKQHDVSMQLSLLQSGKKVWNI